MSDGIRRWADFSPCRTWRYTLGREWEPADPRLLMVLLNPSTADETKDDPTNVRGQGFARRDGFGSLVFCNLFAVRTPDPEVMKQARDPIGPENDEWLMREAAAADRIIVGWGGHGSFRGRAFTVYRMLRNAGHDLWAFKVTKAGEPWHPLYLRADAQLSPYTR